MPILKPQPGEVWKYVGESREKFGEEYRIRELLPAIKKPDWDWHEGVRYEPLELVAMAPNDYTRFMDDFLGCFKYVRG